MSAEAIPVVPVRRPHCARTPDKIKFLTEDDAWRRIERSWRTARRLHGRLTEKDERSRPYLCDYEDGCGYVHITTTAYSVHEPARQSPFRGVTSTPEPDRPAASRERSEMPSVIAKITKETADGDPLEIRVHQRVTVGSRTRKVDLGVAHFIEHDGLAERYAVYADGHQVGDIEVTGRRVIAIPDYDGTYEALFSALTRVL